MYPPPTPTEAPNVTGLQPPAPTGAPSVTGLIVGIVCGVVALILLLALVIFVGVRSQKRKIVTY